MIIRLFHLLLFGLLCGLLAKELFNIGFIDMNVGDENFWKKLILLQASIIWLFEYKFNLHMVIGPAVYQPGETQLRKIIMLIALATFISSMIFLLFGFWPFPI